MVSIADLHIPQLVKSMQAPRTAEDIYSYQIVMWLWRTEQTALANEMESLKWRKQTRFFAPFTFFIIIWDVDWAKGLNRATAIAGDSAQVTQAYSWSWSQDNINTERETKINVLYKKPGKGVM